MAERITLEVATPSRLVIAEQVDEVVVPGIEGYFGVLPGHAALLSTLGIGELSYRIGRDERHAAVAGGFAEVRNDKVIVLADTAELPAEIDRARADRARDRAEQRLSGRGGEDVDYARAAAALARALVRLQVVARPGPGRGRRALPHQALLAGASPVARRSADAAGRMASRVERDPAADYRRLHAAYQQSLRYAEDVRRLYHQLQRAICQSLLGLANALEAKDPYTRGHSERVAALSRRVASALGLTSAVVDLVGQAGLLHDIGKIGVPEAILKKPGPLSPEEWEIMRAHPVIGAQIVAPFEFFGDAARVIRHHHERWDGSGYPDGLVRETIPLEARIVAVADVFDALTSARSYRAALARDAARACLATEAGRTLDETVVAALLGVLDREER